MPVKKGPEHSINGMIRHPEVRLAGKHPATGDKLESRVVRTIEAQTMADELGVDLVMITPNAEPPVCWLIDYQKFLYEQKKKKKEQDQNSSHSETKELRLTPHTGNHDLEFKARHARAWLESGDKVKCAVFFKGRTIAFKEQGEMILLRLATMLEDCGKPESMPKLEGKRMYMNINPKKK